MLDGPSPADRESYGLVLRLSKRLHPRDLPDELSYTDGAQVACGFGTVYEGLEKIGISGDHAVLVVGLGPVGLAALMLAKAMGANKLIGIDALDDRLGIAQRLRLADHVFKAGPENVQEIRNLTNGHGVERALDASGSDKGRLTAIQATRKWAGLRSSVKVGRCS